MKPEMKNLENGLKKRLIDRVELYVLLDIEVDKCQILWYNIGYKKVIK
jgi:hypothetical protein